MRSGTLRGAQQSREWLGDCSGDAEGAVVYRIRLIEPISADFAVLVGDAIRNCGRHSTRLPISWPCSILVRSPRMQKATDEVTDPHLPARSSTIGRLRRTNRRSCAARRSSGSGVPDDSLGTAVRRAAEAISKRSREDAVGRSQEAERDNDVGFVLNRLRNVCKHRRLPLAATLAREGGR